VHLGTLRRFCSRSQSGILEARVIASEIRATNLKDESREMGRELWRAGQQYDEQVLQLDSLCAAFEIVKAWVSGGSEIAPGSPALMLGETFKKIEEIRKGIISKQNL